jgi:cytochrome o ubiquinol oxidase subunit 2
MPGMSTQLNLMATKDGIFNGSSANISGEGFSGMTFTVKASSNRDYVNWIRQLSASPKKLTVATYNQLTKPSQYNKVAHYSNVSPDLYNSIVYKYMSPSEDSTQSIDSVTTINNPKARDINGMVMP